MLLLRHIKKIKVQCLTYYFVFDENKKTLLIKISYGFANNEYDDCVGYCVGQMNWYNGRFNPHGWMVDIIK